MENAEIKTTMPGHFLHWFRGVFCSVKVLVANRWISTFWDLSSTPEVDMSPDLAYIYPVTGPWMCSGQLETKNFESYQNIYR